MAGIETDFPLTRFQRGGISDGALTTFQTNWTTMMSPAEQQGEALKIASMSDYAVGQITALPQVGGAHRSSL